MESKSGRERKIVNGKVSQIKKGEKLSNHKPVGEKSNGLKTAIKGKD